MNINKKFNRFIMLCLIIGSFAMLFPFYWMITTSFKDMTEAMLLPPTFIPNSWSLDAYIELFTQTSMILYLRNTLILVMFSFIGVFINSLCGYGFAKYNFKYKERLFLFVLATMMIPYQVSMIPNFLLITRLGLVDTFLGMILPGLASGFSIFLFRQFMQNIPDEIIEAARVEGLSEFTIFRKIIFPMSKPIYAIQLILAFIGSWNSFLWPLIVAQSDSKYPLSVGLALLQGQNGTDFPLQMAGATFMFIPILIIFIVLQKNILDGYQMSGIK